LTRILQALKFWPAFFDVTILSILHKMMVYAASVNKNLGSLQMQF
jgi:hypothetical protein